MDRYILKEVCVKQGGGEGKFLVIAQRFDISNAVRWDEGQSCRARPFFNPAGIPGALTLQQWRQWNVTSTFQFIVRYVFGYSFM